MVVRFLLLATVLLTFVACGGGPAPAPTAAGVVEPSPLLGSPVAVTPLRTGEALPPSPVLGEAQPVTPLAGGALPAPLYVLASGAIVRVEPDGRVSSEVVPSGGARPGNARVTEFDLAPGDGALAYVVRSGVGSALLRADARGQGAVELLRVDGMISAPRWSPDGRELALRIQPNQGANGELVGGVYRLNASGGGPSLVQADDPVDPEHLPAPRAYAPAAWSPDSARLLLDGTFWFVPLCGLLVKDLPAGALRALATPDDDTTTACGTATWSADSTRVYFNGRYAGKPGLAPGLWWADPTSGKSTSALPRDDGGQALMVRGAQPLGDQLLFFLASIAQAPAAEESAPLLSYTLHRAALDGTGRASLRADAQLLRQVLWAPSGTGAVAEVVRENGPPALVWVPADGGPLLDLAVKGFRLANLRWGKP